MKLTVLLFILFQTAVSFAQLRCVDVVLSLDRNQAIQLPSHNPESVDRLTGFWKPKLLKKFEFNLYGQHLQNLIANKPDLVPLSTLEGKMASIEFARRSTMNPENYRNSVIDEIAWLKTNQQKKIIELLKKNDFSNTYFKDFLPEFSARMYFLLRGFPNKTVDILWKSQDDKFKAEVSHMMGEQLLQKGLLELFKSMTPRRERSDEAIMAEMKSWPLWSFLQMPFQLPNLKLKPIPDALIEKAIKFGEASVQADVLLHFKDQNLAYTYQRTVRPVWKIAFLALLVGYGVHQYPATYAKAQAQFEKVLVEKAEQVIVAVDKQNLELKILNRELSGEIFMKNMKEAGQSQSGLWQKSDVQMAISEGYGLYLPKEKISSLLSNYPKDLSTEQVIEIRLALDLF